MSVNFELFLHNVRAPDLKLDARPGRSTLVRSPPATPVKNPLPSSGSNVARDTKREGGRKKMKAGKAICLEKGVLSEETQESPLCSSPDIGEIKNSGTLPKETFLKRILCDETGSDIRSRMLLVLKVELDKTNSQGAKLHAILESKTSYENTIADLQRVPVRK